MPRRIRRPFDDGRDGTMGDAPGCPIPGLDRIPSADLPKEVDTVFFGGGWFNLFHFKQWTGYVDGHYVFVSPFYISLRPVTIGQCEELMGRYEGWPHETGKHDWTARVKHSYAKKYCNKLSEKEGLDLCYVYEDHIERCRWNANGYRLPTEAEFNYATPGYRRRLPGRPNPPRRRVAVSRDSIPIIDLSSFDLIGAFDQTLFWDYYDPRYFRESPMTVDPAGPHTGYCHSSRVYPKLPFPSNNAFKPYRRPVCDSDRAQFYVVRSWIFESDVRANNQMNKMPQWDR